MQIFKNILLACSIAVATSPLYLQAEDTEAQAAARTALEQKMRELKGLPPVAEPQPRTSPPVVVPAPQAPKPVVAPPPRPAAPVATPEGASPDLIEQARQATRARVTELQGNPNTAIPAGQETVAPKPNNTATQDTTPAVPAYVPEKNSKEEARAKKEREAAARREAAEQEAAAKKAAHEQAMREKSAAKHTTATPPADKTKLSEQQKAEAKAQAAAEKAAEKEAKKNKSGKTIEPPAAFSPLEAPASNLSGSKEQQLQQLTEQYKADKISAEEYHQQRAKILAEP